MHRTQGHVRAKVFTQSVTSAATGFWHAGTHLKMLLATKSQLAYGWQHGEKTGRVCDFGGPMRRPQALPVEPRGSGHGRLHQAPFHRTGAYASAARNGVLRG